MSEPQSGREALGELARIRRGSGREALPVWVLWAVAVGLTIMSLGALGIGIVALRNSSDINSNRSEINKATDRTAGVAAGLTETQRCLTVARNSQRCLERVAGARGPGGSTGAIGAPGKRGERGLAALGKRGPSGKSGAVGKNGATGSPGSQGTAGVQGETGSTGAPGSDGTSGSPGASGPLGLPGINGTPGPKGDQGEPGAPGASGPLVPCAQLDPALGYVCQPPPP